MLTYFIGARGLLFNSASIYFVYNYMQVTAYISKVYEHIFLVHIIFICISSYVHYLFASQQAAFYTLFINIHMCTRSYTSHNISLKHLFFNRFLSAKNNNKRTPLKKNDGRILAMFLRKCRKKSLMGWQTNTFCL